MTAEAKRARILYAEDDPDIREVVETALALDSSLAVFACESGQRVLALLPEVKPDLILLDVMMPELDGLETLQRIRNHSMFNSVPVVFMTAKALPRELESFRALGAAGVIAKPFDPMKLAVELRGYLSARP